MVETFGREKGGLAVSQRYIDRNAKPAAVVDAQIKIHRLHLLLVVVHANTMDTDLMDCWSSGSHFNVVNLKRKEKKRITI